MKTDKARGSLAGTQVKGRLIPFQVEGEEYYWLPLVNLATIDLHAVVKKRLVDLISAGEVPILSSPSLSDRTAKTNRCATVLKTTVREDIVYGLLKPEGKKARVFEQMIVDRFSIITTLGGAGIYVGDSTDRGRLFIQNIHYIRVESVK